MPLPTALQCARVMFALGIPIEVFIKTEERTVISCLAKPFMDQVMKGFREE